MNIKVNKDSVEKIANEINSTMDKEYQNKKQFLIDEENKLNKEIVELYKQIRRKEKELGEVTKELTEYR